MKTPSNPEASQVVKRLTDLAEDSSKIRQYAVVHLARLRMATSLADDVIQRAFVAILQGLENDKGRRPRPQDLDTPEAFEKYVKGIVMSHINTMTLPREFKCTHVPIQGGNLGEYDRGVTLGAPEATRTEVEISDLKNQLFPELRKRAHSTLFKTIAAWEAVFEYSDRIPHGGQHRKYVGQVRELAQTIIHDLQLL